MAMRGKAAEQLPAAVRGVSEACCYGSDPLDFWMSLGFKSVPASGSLNSLPHLRPMNAFRQSTIHPRLWSIRWMLMPHHPPQDGISIRPRGRYVCGLAGGH